MAEEKNIYPLKPSDKQLTLNRWSDVDLVLTWRQSKDGPLFDLTGYAFTLKVYIEFSKTAKPVLEIPVITDFEASTTTLEVLASNLQSIDAGTYKFRLVGTRSGKPRTFWRSEVVLED